MSYAFNVNIKNKLNVASVTVKWDNGQDVIDTTDRQWGKIFTSDIQSYNLTLIPDKPVSHCAVGVKFTTGSEDGHVSFTVDKHDIQWGMEITNPPGINPGTSSTTNVTISENQI